MIRCDSLFLAEYVRFSRDGTLNAITIFDQVTAASLPATLESFWVCAHVASVDGLDHGVHVLRCTIASPVGDEIASQVTQVVLGIAPAAWVVFGFSRVAFDIYGGHTCRVTHEAETCGSLVIPVSPVNTGSYA